MASIEGFPAVANADARVLILGSMPGIASLTQHQYYGHPHNLFWPIMEELVGAHPHLPYLERLAQLTRHQIALWDVMHQCFRPGSLDSAIEEGSIIANDFAKFFAMHTQINHVFFNGQKAAQAFQRHVIKPAKLNQETLARLNFTTLPSTSPANAGIPRETKLQQWRSILQALQGTASPP
ncbi:MAG TPA: DNA-deoxyinosine glycosylase [Methylovorus sp.]|nr:DNA-deoxyinosine glycosylase [Methylovorus sp.]